MDWRLQLLLAFVGSGAFFGFIQFLIQRKDARWTELKNISNSVSEVKEEVTYVKEDIADVKGDLLDTRQELESSIEAHHMKLGYSLEETKAVNARVRILSASDEIRHHIKHSKEWFDQLNEDITFYEKYCGENPGFKNNRATLAIANINRVYANALEDNDFLT